MSRPTLPGDIGGLLRRGSPVEWNGLHGIVVDLLGGSGERAVIACHYDAGGAPRIAEPLVSTLALDLTDPTGRAHAAWWLAGADRDDVDAAIREHAGTREAVRLLVWWCSGVDCPEGSIKALRHCVLTVAGREVTP